MSFVTFFWVIAFTFNSVILQVAAMRFCVGNMDSRQAQSGSTNKLPWWNCQVSGIGDGCQS